MDMTGRTLKHYRIEAVLGKGGMGVVYRARDTRLDRPVALKILESGLLQGANRDERFLREARAAAAISHPAIAHIYDIDEADGTAFIAMEYIDGRTVSRLIAEKELDLSGALEIALQIAEGLEQAHRSGILHRDIKSDNIMVTGDGRAKLLDFGLAKLLQGGTEDSGPALSSGRTMTMKGSPTLAGTVMGTIPYMSPEQARGKDMDSRSDIFSLGIVLYEMATAELPFRADTALDTLHAIAYEEPRPVTRIRKNLPPGLQAIISRCLRKRREDRYPDAGALAYDIRRLKQEIETGTSGFPSQGERLIARLRSLLPAFSFNKKGLLILAVATVVVTIILFVIWKPDKIISVTLSPIIIFLLVYRRLRNRKRRLLARFARKTASDPSVKAVVLKNDVVTVAVEKAPLKSLLRIAGAIDAINRKLFFGTPLSASILEELKDEDIRLLLRDGGILYYLREDLPARKGKRTS